MARADELEPGERIRHPDTGDVVEVTKITNLLSVTRVYFRARGMHGKLVVSPQRELEEM